MVVVFVCDEFSREQLDLFDNTVSATNSAVEMLASDKPEGLRTRPWGPEERELCGARRG